MKLVEGISKFSRRNASLLYVRKYAPLALQLQVTLFYLLTPDFDLRLTGIRGFLRSTALIVEIVSFEGFSFGDYSPFQRWEFVVDWHLIALYQSLSIICLLSRFRIVHKVLIVHCITFYIEDSDWWYRLLVEIFN